MILFAILSFLLGPFVQTKEDQENRQFYENLYEKNKEFLKESASSETRIPKTLHFISHHPPKNIQKWAEKYPNWTLKVWSDRIVDEEILGDLADCYYQADSLEEKSQILSYAILYKEGGVYIEEDLLPKEKLDPLHEQFDFYCELEKPGPSILSTSVFPTNHVLAGRAGHPIFLHTLHWIKENWQRLRTCEVKYRTISALIEGVRLGIDQDSRRDIVLPPSETWVRKEKVPESKSAQMLHAITQQNNRTLTLVMMILLLNSTLFVILLKKMKTR